MQIEALLTEVSPDAPCGPDLEYDPEFMALEQAAQGKPEQQFGETIVPAVDPNWADVRMRAEALFGRTKDLRVAVLLVRAWLRSAEFPGLCDGLTLLHQMLERYWDQVYPRIEAEYDNDPTMRLNVLNALLDANGFLRDLRTIHVVPAGAKGRVMVRDVLLALGKLPAGSEPPPSVGQIQAVVRDTATDNAAVIEAARRSAQVSREMQALLSEQLGTEQSLDLRPLIDVLDAVVKTCDAALGTSEGTGNVDADGASESGTEQAGVSGGGFSGQIRSRDDAIRILEQVCEFMERTEPSHPAPLLIRRAQRLLSKNFIEIMEDLAPDSLGAIKGVAGI